MKKKASTTIENMKADKNKRNQALSLLLGTTNKKKTNLEGEYVDLKKLFKTKHDLYNDSIRSSWETLQAKMKTAPEILENKTKIRWVTLTGLSFSVILIVFILRSFLPINPEFFIFKNYKMATKLNIDDVKNLSFSKKSLVSASLGQSTNLWIRGASDFSISNNDEQTKIKFDSGKLLFQFKPKHREKLSISTQNTTFTVLGTEFLIESTSKNVNLLVFSGKVKVVNKLDKNQQITLVKNQVWSKHKQAQVSSIKSIDAIKRLKVFKKEPVLRSKEKNNKKLPKLNKELRVILINGNIIQGKVVLENQDIMQILTKLNRVFEVKIKNIKKIQYL